MNRLTHFDEKGKAKMVDVKHKPDTERIAIARGSIIMKSETFEKVRRNEIIKGDVLTVAKVAGIMAGKKTSEFIPLCHPLMLTHVDLSFNLDKENNKIEIESRVSSVGKTGVEMEALTAVAIAALTIYDMCKGVDKEMIISNIRLLEKQGGKSGTFRREENEYR